MALSCFLLQRATANSLVSGWGPNLFRVSSDKDSKYWPRGSESNVDISGDLLSCILYMINIYSKKKDSELLGYITLFIENYYNYNLLIERL